MRPWMIRGLERERCKLERQRRRRAEELLQLRAPASGAEGWQTEDIAETAEQDEGLLVHRGVWTTEL